jgi:hypothetical protein
MPRQIHAPIVLLVPAILLAVLLGADSVRGESRVTGQPDAVRVEARDTPVEEVLGALGQNFGLYYRSTAPLSRRVTGTYVGSLQRVVARLLDGYDFVMKTDAGSVEVVVYGVVKPGETVLAPKSVQAPTKPQVARPAQGEKSSRKARRERRRLVK